MNYILQVFTGGWNHSNYSVLDIKKRVSTIAGIIPVKAIIIGWNLEKSLYQELGEWLQTQNIKMFLWLPVLSEIGELIKCRSVVDLDGNEIEIDGFQSDENFVFYCPADEDNWRACIKVYEKYFSGCPFDGVFLDKIRTQTATAGVKALFSCGCDLCKRKYQELGVNLDEIKKILEEKGDEAMSLEDYDSVEGLLFRNKTLSKYFDAKSQIISRGVNTVVKYFHEKNKEVGLDLFFPLIAPLVGQNYTMITKEADFIKPMMYRRTQAPAGIPFEYKSLVDSIPGASGYPDIKMTNDFLKDQVTAARQSACGVYPGIEINYRDNVARTDEEYVYESVKTLQEADAQGAVLAWDVMQAPLNHIECLSRLEGQ